MRAFCIEFFFYGKQFASYIFTLIWVQDKHDAKEAKIMHNIEQVETLYNFHPLHMLTEKINEHKLSDVPDCVISCFTLSLCFVSETLSYILCVCLCVCVCENYIQFIKYITFSESFKELQDTHERANERSFGFER